MPLHRFVRRGCVTGILMAFFTISARAQEQQHYQAARAALMEGDKERAKLEVKLALQENSNTRKPQSFPITSGYRIK